VIPGIVSGTFGPWVLGIDWGHLGSQERVFIEDNESTYHITDNSGFACVVPAWKLIELLNQEELVKQREVEDARIAKVASS
jgi:hypothetical protein